MPEEGKDELAVFISSFAESMHGRRLGVTQSKVSELLVGYSVLYRRLQRALKRALASTDAYETRRSSEGWDKSTQGDTNEHLDDFLDVVYAASEIFELYETEVVKLLKTTSKNRNDYRSKIKKLKRFSVLLCNICKHEFSYLQCVEVKYENNSHVSGYAVYHMNNMTAVPNDKFHKCTPAFSMNWSFRQIVIDLLLADISAAELVTTIQSGSGDDLASITYTLPIFKEIIAIEKLSQVGMPNEIRRAYFQVLSNNYVDINLDNHTVEYQGQGKMRCYIDLIARSTAIRLPYLPQDSLININTEAGSDVPLPAFFRIVAADVNVIDE